MLLRSWCLLAALFFLALGACSPASSLSVQLQTDLVPGREIDSVRVELTSDSGAFLAMRELDVSRARGLGRPVRVAEFADLSSGTFDAQVTLFLAGRPVQSRPARVRVAGPTFVTLLMLRDCNGVSCPESDDDPTASACLGGRCVAAECTEERPELCGAAECIEDAACPRGGVACVLPRCSSSGACFSAADDSACAAGSTCDEALGCVAGGLDAGVSDSAVPTDASVVDALDAAVRDDTGPRTCSMPGVFPFVVECGDAVPGTGDADGDGLSDASDPDPAICNRLVDLFDASEIPGPPWSDPTRAGCPWTDGDVTTAVLGVDAPLIIRARFVIDSVTPGGNVGLSIEVEGLTLWCNVGDFGASRMHLGPLPGSGGIFGSLPFEALGAPVVVQMTRRASSPTFVRCEAIDADEAVTAPVDSNGIGTAAASTLGFGVYGASATLDYVAVFAGG